MAKKIVAMHAVSDLKLLSMRCTASVPKKDGD